MNKLTSALLALLMLLALPNLQAQTSPSDKNAFSAKLLFIDYGQPNDEEGLDLTNGVEISYIRNLLPWLNFALPLKTGVINVHDDINNRTFFSADGLLQIQYAKPEALLTPYLLGGGGIALEQELGSNVQFPFGAGLNIRLGPQSFLNLQGEYRISQAEKRNNLQAGIGYLYRFGNMDRDGDGVPDSKDRCPDQPGPAATQGCPDTDGDGIPDIDDKCPARPGLAEFDGCPDTDGDGIPDHLDDCPETAGLAEFGGCPDSDGDGIPDHLDDCPDQPGPAATDGCPDSDGDGIPDKDDECPDEPGTAATNGCPDRDGDGIADKDDECPDQPGPAATKGCPDRDADGFADKDDLCPDVPGTIDGCPDSDGDGVHDGIDACPDQPGPASNKGCPEIEDKDKEVLSFAMRAVQFETGKANLKEESKEILDQIAAILNRYPGYALSMNGFTDNVGRPASNQLLSEERAKACYTYLVSLGISPKRLSYQGFGEEQPIASNKTSSGRKLNRRVEFNMYIE